MKNKLIVWCDARQATLGWWMLRLGMAMAVIAFPAQIWKIYTEQRCGISLILILLPMLIYGVRIPYSISKRAWELIAPDAIGLASCSILLGQYFYYNHMF